MFTSFCALCFQLPGGKTRLVSSACEMECFLGWHTEFMFFSLPGDNHNLYMTAVCHFSFFILSFLTWRCFVCVRAGKEINAVFFNYYVFMLWSLVNSVCACVLELSFSFSLSFFFFFFFF